MCSRFSILVLSLCVFAFCLTAEARNCRKDRNCKRGRVCYLRKCTALTEDETLIKIKMKRWVPNTSVYIDDVLMGILPWEGIISSGVHSIRVQAPGYEPAVFRGKARKRRREVVRVKLSPSKGPVATAPDEAPETAAPSNLKDPDSPDSPDSLDSPDSPDVSSEPQQETWEKIDPGDMWRLPGVMTLGLLGGGGFGFAKWGDADKGQTGWWQTGGVIGAALARKTVWFELSAVVMYGIHYVTKWPVKLAESRFKELRLGILPRVLFPVRKNRLYFGFEVEGGGLISHINYLYIDFRLSMSVFIHPMFEFRISPGGIEWIYDFSGKGSIFGVTGTFGVVVRFV